MMNTVIIRLYRPTIISPSGYRSCYDDRHGEKGTALVYLIYNHVDNGMFIVNNEIDSTKQFSANQYSPTLYNRMLQSSGVLLMLIVTVQEGVAYAYRLQLMYI